LNTLRDLARRAAGFHTLILVNMGTTLAHFSAGDQ
jgi:hypothetical protein